MLNVWSRCCKNIPTLDFPWSNQFWQRNVVLKKEKTYSLNLHEHHGDHSSISHFIRGVCNQVMFCMIIQISDGQGLIRNIAGGDVRRIYGSENILWGWNSFWWQASQGPKSMDTIASSKRKSEAGFLGDVHSDGLKFCPTLDLDQLNFLQYWSHSTAKRIV